MSMPGVLASFALCRTPRLDGRACWAKLCRCHPLPHFRKLTAAPAVSEVDDFSKIAEIGEHPLPPYPIQEPARS